MNLENAVSSADAPFIFKWTARQGIYKVIFYAKTADASVAGWKVQLQDTSATKSNGQANELNTWVPCKNGDAATEGTNTVEIICDERLAAKEVRIQFAGGSTLELAEVVVVGKPWVGYPCALGYFSSNGFHADSAAAGDGCQICANGHHEPRTTFAATDTPTACTACSSTKKIYYTNTDDHKKLNQCQKCTNHLVVLNSNTGACTGCPAGQEYTTTGAASGCDMTHLNANDKAKRASAESIAIADPSACDTVTCGACEDGYRNPADSATYCHRCPKAREYTENKILCKTCEDGKVANTAGTGCVNCVAGKSRDSTQDDCVACDPGKISDAGQASCTECEKGKYEVTRTECKLCPKGKYNSLTGQSGVEKCLDCDAGWVAATEGLETCTQCLAGTYAQSATVACVNCEVAKIQASDGGTSCTACPVGEIPNPGATACITCAAGEEYVATGDHADCNYNVVRNTPTTITVTDHTKCTEVKCQACPVGYVNSENSKKYCHKCQEPRQHTLNQIDCVNCNKGQVADSSGKACEDCPAGEFRRENDLDCLPCEAGSKSEAGAEICTPCEKGKYEDGRTHCIECPEGKYNSLTGQSGLVKCLNCPDGTVATTKGKETCDICQPGTYGPADKTKNCVTCEAGQYQDVAQQSSCIQCPAGEIPNHAKTECVKCAAGSVPNGDQSECVACPAGKYQSAAGQTACIPCGEGKFTETTGQIECKICEAGQEANPGRTACVDCVAGKYQESTTGGSCTDCPAGKYSSAPKSASCTPCAVGMYQIATGSSSCDKCPAGKYSDTEGANSCTDCGLGHVTREAGMSKCESCQPGYKANLESAATDCDKCEAGTYQDRTGQTKCKDCAANYFSDKEGQISCKRCEDHQYAVVGSSKCSKCPAPEDGESILKEKCDNDDNQGCASANYENQYGNFSHKWLKKGEFAEALCVFDDDKKTAVFTCKMIDGKLLVEETYYCIKSNKTNEIAELATSDTLTTEEKTEQLVDLTEDTAMNGLGDVEAVSQVLSSIGISNDTSKTDKAESIKEEVTKTILESVSNLVQSDLKVASSETQQASNISTAVVNQVVNVARQTDVKNTVIKSPRLAVIDIKSERDNAPSKKGIVAFSLPKSERTSKNKGLQNCSLAEDDNDDNTFLMIETKKGEEDAALDMAVVLITDSTLMPDAKISIIKQEETENDDDTVQQILEDLKKDMQDKEAAKSDEKVNKKYVNSFITEISVENAPEDFKLNLFMKPTVDIGNMSLSLNTESDGKRVEVTYICAKYDTDKAEWTEDCDTIYDKADPSAGVLCLCDHNTSFAVLMSAYEIDRGYAEVQSYLTYVLLGLSTVGLLLTLVCLLPAKALRSTRSAKINICFTTALLLSSLLFLIQDAFVNAEDTGVIKLKSTACAVYAMLQHYLWLVVFSWMVVEGFLMYLSLVQVFGSHISKYMLKFNLAAWGIPLPIPFIGYFVFTKDHTVGSFTFTDHGYLADTMCFIKPESIPFYALFLAPIVLVILVNLVFFALVAKVIKNSKSSGSISDQEQILRQLKAAVGVMVLLGTGWFFGIFMSIPTPQFQVGMQYLFILLNGTQGMFVFLFYIVLNDQVKSHWLVKMGLQEEKKATTSSSAAGKSTATKATAVSVSAAQNQADNIYENAAASNEEHTYASAEYATAGDKAKKHEFPAKSDNNANI